MQTKEFALEVKGLSEDGSFEGYASTFGGSPDSYGDIVVAGAFVDSLAAHVKQGTMPALLWGHGHNSLPIGDWVEFAEDKKGLWGKGRLDLDDPEGARVHRALKAKRVRGLSIGYETLRSRPDEKRPGVSFLEKVDLWEVSVVNFPANRRAGITTVKSILDAGALPTVREFEEFLRDAGFSKSLATAIAGKATPHLRGEPEAKAKEQALTALRAAAAAFLTQA